MSAASYEQLVGVPGQTIYHWKQSKARLRAAQLEALRQCGVSAVAKLWSA